MKIVLASSNEHKVKEINDIVKGSGLEFVLPPKGFDPIEDGETFEENSLKKAKAAWELSKTWSLADDSGLCVDALDGAPGVYSARFAGEHGNDDKNNEKLLSLLSDVPPEKRTARFVSTVACVFPDGRELVVRGECEGKIGYEKRGENGFGYDPLFYVGERTFAEFTPEEKDAVSHRGNALRALTEALPAYLEKGE